MKDMCLTPGGPASKEKKPSAKKASDRKSAEVIVCIYIFMLVFCGKWNTIILEPANQFAS